MMARIGGLMVILLLVVSTASAEDRLELDSISIKGSRELPKVLYIVPWKSARLGAFEASAGGSTLDTEMEALDRDVFRRQVEYYGMLFGEGKTAANR
ncbi:hypothetical protein [Kaarinaea lacus]